MPSLADIADHIDAYRNGSVSVDDFEDWFRTSSRSMFGEGQEVLDAFLAIEQAFSRFRFEGIAREEFLEELAAVRPFALGPVYAQAREIVYGKPPQKARAATHSSLLRVSAAGVA